MADPKVSVVLPTRNRAALLERAIESVFAQTFEDLELIVVDDASDDNTDTIRTKFEGHRHVKWISLAEPKGAYYTRNIGLEAATGRYVAFLDDDDWWFPEKLQRQVGILDSEADVAMVGCWYQFSGRIWKVPDTVPLRQLLSLNFLACPTLILRKSDVDAVGGFDETLQNSGDWDLWIRMAERGRVKYVQDCLVYCSTVSPNRLTKRNPQAYYADLMKVLGRHEHQMSFWTRRRHYYNWLYHTAQSSPRPVRWTLGFLYLLFRELDSLVARPCPTARIPSQ